MIVEWEERWLHSRAGRSLIGVMLTLSLIQRILYTQINFSPFFDSRSKHAVLK